MGDNPNDDELLGLIPFLHALQFTTDVRSILSLKGPTLGSESNDNNINNNSPPITTNIEPILPKYNYSIKHYIFFLFLVLVLGLAHNPNAYLAWMFAEFFEKILPLILLYSFIGIWAYRKSLFYSSTQIPYRWK